MPGRADSETIREFSDLDRLNRLFQFARPFQESLPSLIGPANCAELELLDVGAGTGSLGKSLSAWAERVHGWNWNFTNLDSNPLGFRLGNPPRQVIGSALLLPFADESFDVVIASQMTHHLLDSEVVQHLKEAWRVSRAGVIISDVHRNAGLYGLLWLCTRILRLSPSVKSDALTSVRRGFHLKELRHLAEEAGLRGSWVWLYYGTRILLRAKKT